MDFQTLDSIRFENQILQVSLQKSKKKKKNTQLYTTPPPSALYPRWFHYCIISTFFWKSIITCSACIEIKLYERSGGMYHDVTHIAHWLTVVCILYITCIMCTDFRRSFWYQFERRKLDKEKYEIYTHTLSCAEPSNSNFSLSLSNRLFLFIKCSTGIYSYLVCVYQADISAPHKTYAIYAIIYVGGSTRAAGENI